MIVKVKLHVLATSAVYSADVVSHNQAATLDEVSVQVQIKQKPRHRKVIAHLSVGVSQSKNCYDKGS